MLNEECNWGRMGPTVGPALLEGLRSTVRTEAVFTGESSVRGLLHSTFKKIIAIFETFNYR